MNNGKLILKIVVPLLLVCVVVGIWAVKTIQKSNNASINPTSAQTDLSGSTGASANPDFALNVTNNNLDIEKLKSYGLPIIIEFGAEWCSPCKQMAPIIKALNEELQGKAIVRFVNTDENQKTSQAYNFQYIPTQLFINADGTPYNPANAAAMQMDLKYDSKTNELLYTTHTGTLTKAQLLDILEEMGMN
jgi:thioredoxin 1